jgi:hypothetical protein
MTIGAKCASATRRALGRNRRMNRPFYTTFDFVMRCWTQAELAENLHVAGFDAIEFFGDYDSAAPVGTTDRIIAVATFGLYKN